ncbi:MAG: NAD(P)-dependent oxidoreductase [Dysgonamonadaceae bacterium]|jgi:nucleoside-diphosphate-sugar epimerase|nr:NAD(P)-dependent oxidoreductase [Dysgonamonadaceae bacterium]
MKKILITGASGFIGSFLVEGALAKGWQTWAGIRSSSSKEYLQDERIRFIDLNFSNKEKLKDQICRHTSQYGSWDYVIHNAGVTKCLNSDDFEKVNFLYSKHLIEALQESGNVPEKFILMSSLSAHHSEVKTKYGNSKLKAEHFLKSQSGFPYIILCPTGVYGPRDKDYYLMLKMLQSGWSVMAGFKRQELTFIYVEDLVKAALLALESPISNKLYFISDGDVYSDAEYTSIAKKVLGKKRIISLRVPLWMLQAVSILSENMAKRRNKPATLNRDKYQIMKQRDWTCNIFPIVKDLNFYVDYPLKRGLEKTAAWYRVNGWL